MNLRFFALLPAILFLMVFQTNAETKPVFLIFDFELEDYTKTPQGDEEIQAIANLKTDFSNLLAEAGFPTQTVTQEEWGRANKSVGYVFGKPGSVRELAEEYEAGYYVVGKISKPSNLFIYLTANVFDTKTGQGVGNYQVEVKGQWKTMLKRGLKRITKKISKRWKKEGV